MNSELSIRNWSQEVEVLARGLSHPSAFTVHANALYHMQTNGLCSFAWPKFCSRGKQLDGVPRANRGRHRAGNREGRDRAIPVIGGPINQVLSLVLAPAVGRRRDEWLKELADALDQMEKKVAGFRVEKLADNEAFVSATIRATLIAIGTHQREKREYLRNALLNIAKGITSDEIKQQVFLNAIEAFTPTHIKALNLTEPMDDDLRGLISAPICHEEVHYATRQDERLHSFRGLSFDNCASRIGWTRYRGIDLSGGARLEAR